LAIDIPSFANNNNNNSAATTSLMKSSSSLSTAAMLFGSLSPTKSDDSYVRSPTMLFHPPGRRRSSLFMVDQAKIQNDQTWDYVSQALLKNNNNIDQSMTMGVYARIRSINKSELDLQNEICVNVVDDLKSTVRIVSAKEKTNDFQ
jgi:hypothetical protein